MNLALPFRETLPWAEAKSIRLLGAGQSVSPCVDARALADSAQPMSAWREHLAGWWDALAHPEHAGRLVLGTAARSGFTLFLTFVVAVLYCVYGVGMGMFRGGFPALMSGLKLPLLYLLTVAVCFPSLYVLNCLVGPRLSARQNLRLLLLAVSVNAVALASYAPVSYFFTATTSRSSYGFLVMMHVVVFALSGAVSLVVIGVILRATAAEMGMRVRPVLVVMWGGLYGVVGAEMSWLLRPWIGAWEVAYAPFRPIEGSFFESVAALLR
jgi:hypothetical protein